MIRNHKPAPAFGHRFCNQMARIRDIAATDRERAMVTMLKGLTEVTDLALYMRDQTELLIQQVHGNTARTPAKK